MQTRNFAEEFQSCRRPSHGDGSGENLCLCCSRDSLGAYGIPPNLKCGRGGRQRIPRDERPKPPLPCERDRKFESISLQQTVRLSPAATFERQEPGLSPRVCEARLTTGSAETQRAFHCAPNGGNVSAGPYSSTARAKQAQWVGIASGAFSLHK